MKFLLHTTICILLIACFFIDSNVLYAQNCNGTPLLGGTATASNTTLCAGLYTGISVNGGSTTGVAYQWESSVDNINWTAVTNNNNATLATFSTNQSGLYYRRRVTCTNGGSIAYSTSVNIQTNPFTNCYCIPFSYCSTDYTISNVSYASLNNTSTGCSTNGYSNFKSSVAAPSVMQGSLLPISVAVGTSFANKTVECYIDFDHSGSFDARENISLTSFVGNVYNGYIRIPYHAFTGTTAMRVIYSATATSACPSGYNAEVEDYLVTITTNTNTTLNGHVIYVKETATGSDNSGRNWVNAYTNLQKALQTAGTGDTIKVAKGTYNSNTSAVGNGYELRDSIVLLGGYPSTGAPTDANRNPGANLTVLSGFKSNYSGNYHLLYASGPMPYCIVDGVVLENGGSNAGTTASQMRGGGLSAENGANPTLRNCIVRNNYPYMRGTAVAINRSAPVFYNCIITTNTNGLNYATSQGYSSIVLIENNSAPAFYNLLITGNRAPTLIHSDSSTIAFLNSTVAKNNSENNIINAVNQSSINLTNSITYYNSYQISTNYQPYVLDTADVKLTASTASFTNSITQINSGGINSLVGYQPRFKDTSNAAGADGVFFTDDDGLSLINPCSPAINAGSNALTTNNPTDITGRARIFDGVADIGAYEIQQARMAIPATVFVRANATGLNNGSSWANAFTDFNKALQSCSDTIKVATGSYSPGSSVTQPFLLENKRIILGAYPTTGNPTNADRDYSLYTTTFTNTATNSYLGPPLVQGNRLDSTSVLDGITFSNFGNNQLYSSAVGAISYTNCNNPIISNCVFTGNTRLLFYGKNNQNPTFTNCNFLNNNFQNGGSPTLDLLTIDNCTATTFKKCSFNNNLLEMSTNIVGEFGKIFNINRSNPVFDSCTFLKNMANVLYNVYSNTTVRNSSFINNYTGYNATDIKNENSNPVFSKCIFRDSAWISYQLPLNGGIVSNRLSNPLFIDCQFYNGKVAKYGGLAYNDSSLAVFTNCVMSGCKNAIYNTNSSNILLNNCIGIGNEYVPSYNTGSFMTNSRSNPMLNNCTIVNNVSSGFGVVYNDDQSFPKIRNCIFWKNFKQIFFDTITLNARGDIWSPLSSQATANNSAFEFFNGGTTNGNTRKMDPRFVDVNNPAGGDGIWFTADDGLRLCTCSPAINTGNNIYATVATDIANTPRLFGTNVDRGAYELQTMPPANITITYYVNAAATGNNTGTSWVDAYTSVYTAIGNTCADTIKITEGVYKPAVQNRDSLFSINRNTVLLGSYNLADLNAATDVEAHPTIFSGEIGNLSDSTDNSKGLITVSYADTVRIDGIVFSKTNNGVFTNPVGTAPMALNAGTLRNLDISNCRFYNNTSQNNGGAVYFGSLSKLSLRKVIFSQNVSASSGGGMYLQGVGNSARIIDCIFDNNTANTGGGVGGGGVCCGITVSFTNCLFNANTALYGGGIYMSEDAGIQLNNCTFSNNRCQYGVTRGIGIYSTGSVAGMIVTNSIFAGNTPIGQTSPQGSYQDIYAANDGTNVYDASKASIHHSTVSTPPLSYSGGGNIYPYLIQFKNPGSSKGNDNKWFTVDDGLGLSICSGGIDAAQNSSNTNATDLAGRPRIFNGTIDMGAYEWDGTPGSAKILTTANDSLIANKEVTDADGWTHYYKDCYYLISLQKRGYNIGTIGDGTFRVMVKTTPAYSSGTSINLSNASCISPGVTWKVMNRYWTITPTNEPTDSLQIRFTYTSADFNDVKGGNPSISQHQQMVAYKEDGINNPLSTTILPANFHSYLHATTPSKTKWTFAAIDTSTFQASYFVRTLRGGGGAGVMDTVCTSGTNIWLGITPQWDLPNNWSTGQLPTVCANVIINGGVPFMPEITSPNSACYSLTLTNGATVIIRTGGNLTIIGP